MCFDVSALGGNISGWGISQLIQKKGHGCIPVPCQKRNTSYILLEKNPAPIGVLEKVLNCDKKQFSNRGAGVFPAVCSRILPTLGWCVLLGWSVEVTHLHCLFLFFNPLRMKRDGVLISGGGQLIIHAFYLMIVAVCGWNLDLVDMKKTCFRIKYIPLTMGLGIPRKPGRVFSCKDCWEMIW